MTEIFDYPLMSDRQRIVCWISSANRNLVTCCFIAANLAFLVPTC